MTEMTTGSVDSSEPRSRHGGITDAASDAEDAVPEVDAMPDDAMAEADSVQDSVPQAEAVPEAEGAVDDPGAAAHEPGDDVDRGSEAGGVPSRNKGSTLRRLEEEGEVAADYLEELLDIVDLDGDIDIDVENGRASVAIVAENGADRDLRRLVGARGEVLEALQDLVRLAVQARTGERSRLMLDVAGYRAGRRRALEDVAARACQEVARTGQPTRLAPMSAFERKVIHDVVAEAGLVSESEGEDPARCVVIHPAVG